MGIASKILTALLGLAFGTAASAGQFYLFPVQEIEGLAAKSVETRPMIDARLVKKVFGETAGQQAQRQVVGHFVANLNAAYPASVIHAKQVYDSPVGSGHKFVNDEQLACKQAPSFNVADTYAVVLGITRASLYEVVKGNNIEVLVPITLNIQFIKPNLGKIVYTLSETMYSPFRFSRAEYESGAVDGVMRDVIMKNVQGQISSLVDTARNGFNPKDVMVKLVDKDGKFYVADKGIGAGFVKGEQVEARDASDVANIFDVLYVDSDYAVLKPAAGTAAVGDSLRFIFEKAADDSRKPRLMPVVGLRQEDSWTNSVSDIFLKNIGFSASFQLSPVDVNFAQTKELITRSANCVTWQKIPSMAEASGQRKDAPNFFLKYTPSISPTAILSGSGGTKSSESFHTLVTAQVIDQSGKVISSEFGDNNYVVERINGEGLNIEQAKEISLKNATQKLAMNVIANVRFEPKDYPVVKVDKDRLWIEGMQEVQSSEKLSFDVLHPLSAKAHGKPVMIDLDVGSGSVDVQMEGGLLGLPYSISNPQLPKPGRGDVVRLYSKLPSGMTKVQDCSDPTYIGQNNLLNVDYLAPLIRHAIYKSNKFASYIGDPGFYSDANNLLKQGMFDLELVRPSIELCSQPGYAIREENLQCEGTENCKSTVAMGIVARLKKGTEVQKTFSSGLRSEFSGFQSANKNGFYGYKQLSNGISMQSDFINKLNLN